MIRKKSGEVAGAQRRIVEQDDVARDQSFHGNVFGDVADDIGHGPDMRGGKLSLGDQAPLAVEQP